MKYIKAKSVVKTTKRTAIIIPARPHGCARIVCANDPPPLVDFCELPSVPDEEAASEVVADVADVTAKDSSGDEPESSPFTPDMSVNVGAELLEAVVEALVEVDVEDTPNVGSESKGSKEPFVNAVVLCIYS